ncbi:CMGC kinase [Fusarium mexicanum]|uniref:CMGC kinase n=1 Tax=Fusarium mexicanum TaxID=751941 RepID=A0A8H5N138_9HYPO|nr:CMGC kinase [Fusarium mexicanum]
MEFPTDQEIWRKDELVAPMSPKDSFVVQDTKTLADFGLTIRSDIEVDFKLQIPAGYCAPERMPGINPTFASDMWSYVCIFAELYLKWPLFGTGVFGGGLRSIVGFLMRVLGPVPLAWNGSYEGGDDPDESLYDQSRIPELGMSLESRVM